MASVFSTPGLQFSVSPSLPASTMQEADLHDLSDDPDYAASQQQVFLACLPTRSSVPIREAFVIVTDWSSVVLRLLLMAVMLVVGRLWGEASTGASLLSRPRWTAAAAGPRRFT